MLPVLLFLLAAIASAQTPNAVMRRFPGVPTGACSFVQFALNAATNDLYDCPNNASWHLAASGGGAGTVTSVGALSPLFTTANPTTTPSFSLISQAANQFFASPNGGAGVASFRSVVAADLPATTVTPGSYTHSSLTVDQQGRLTAASSGTTPPTIAATTSALKGDGAGNAAAVTGTGSNCVHVDGTSVGCTGGSGGVTVFETTGNPVVDLTNSNMETTLWSQAITGLGNMGELHVSLYMLLLNTSGSQTITFREKLGATTLMTHTVINGASANAIPTQLIIDISDLNATNAQFALSRYIQSQGVSSGTVASVLAGLYQEGMNNTSTVDMTMNPNLVITAQWTNANMTTDLKFYAGRIEQY